MVGVIEFFLVQARELLGVRRIALVGSITEPKKESKDLDLLVYVDREVPLAALAQLGRRARGRLQSINRGWQMT
jgi:predicted nucleotidyltransferase